MSTVANDLREAMEQAIAFVDGTGNMADYRVTMPFPVDVKSIRSKLKMSQSEFAQCFGFSVNTLRHWEQGNRLPEGPTRAYLTVIDRIPQAVKEALAAA